MNIKLALHDGVLDALLALPKPQQQKFRSFMTKFRNDPKSSGINFEKINDAADPNLRSVRVDQAYRAIVHKPEEGNSYIVLWVDHHDKAYDWARRKRVVIAGGVIQLYDLEYVDALPKEPVALDEGLFDGVRDRELVRLGLPEELIPLVRLLREERDLELAEPTIPTIAYENLYYYAMGESLEELFREMDRRLEVAAQVANDDYAAALDNEGSLHQFVVVDDDEELQTILDAPLAKWRVFLHPSQRRLIRMNANGPVRVTGGAGTGKTVVAMHRAKRLAEEVFTSDTDRILFTTFTRNLAGDIHHQLESICSEEAMRRIEVVHLDRWAVRFLQRVGYGYRPAYGRVIDEAWGEAESSLPDSLGVSIAFVKEEFYSVILPQGLQQKTEYIVASRIGRGTKLGRKQRAQIWPVVKQYRSILAGRGLKEPQDCFRDARELLKRKNLALPYRAVIVDEAQDMSAEALRLIRQLIPGGDQANDLFIVGDAHQRIYGYPVILSRCGINIRGRGRRLRINYRTPEEVRDWAVGLLRGMDVDDLDGEAETQFGYRSLIHGTAPSLKHAKDFVSEVHVIATRIRELLEADTPQASICIVARTNRLLQQYEGALQMENIPLHRVSRDKADDPAVSGVRLATMHRVKGLEYDHVCIAGVNHDVIPLSSVVARAEDQVERREREKRERSLLYVAATRAKRSVLVTSFGTPSEFIA